MKRPSKTMVIAGGLALSGVIVASLAVAGSNSIHDRKHRMIDATSLDSNGDGALSRDELLSHSKHRFDRLDTNEDGTISANEFSARLAAMFTRMDTNEDGLLQGDELPRRMRGHGGKLGGGDRHGGRRDHDKGRPGSFLSPDTSS